MYLVIAGSMRDITFLIISKNEYFPPVDLVL